MGAVDKLIQLGLSLPAVLQPAAHYGYVVRSGRLLFLSGHTPWKVDQNGDLSMVKGKVGANLTLREGYAAAKLTTLNLLASMNAELGDLDRIRRILKMVGYVNCTEDFTDHGIVLDGASDLLVGVFGETGRHARSAIGVTQLPSGVAVEIDLVAEVE